MAISDTIQSMYENVGEVYDTITNVTLPDHKNIENIPRTIRNSYLEIMNNGINVIYDNWEKVIGEGTSLTLTPTEEAPMKIVLKGNTTQETTTGKNKCGLTNETKSNGGITGVSNNGIITLNNTATTTSILYFTFNYTFLANTTYSVSANNPVANSNIIIRFDGNVAPFILTNANQTNTFSFENDTTVTTLCVRTTSGTSLTNFIIKPQLEIGQPTSYEPYTGGTASPNPDYPQDIHVVSGDNEVKIIGKNHFDYASASDTNNTSVTQYRIFKISDLKPNARYNINNTSFTSTIANTYIYMCSTDQYSTSTRYRVLTPTEYSNFTTFVSSNTGEIYLAIYPTDTTSWENIIQYFSNAQIEEGSQATTYKPYTSQNYPINLPVENKFNINALDMPNATIENNTLTLLGSSDYHSTNTGNNLKDIADLKAGETYTLSFVTTYTSSNKMYLRGSQSNWNNGESHIITQQELDDRIAFYGVNGDTIKNIQIEKGSKNNSYTPYGTTPIEMCSIPNTTYKDTFIRNSGKNLFDGELELGYINGNTGQNASNDNLIRCKNYIPVDELTNYKFSCLDSNITTVYVYEYKEDYSYNLTTNYSVDLTSYLTTKEGTKYIRFRPSYQTTDTSIKFMLNEGTTALPYEPHGNGEWFKKGEIFKKTFDGTEDIRVANTGTANWYYYYTYTTNIASGATGISKYYSYGNIENNNTNQGFNILSGYFRFRFGTEDTTTNYKTWLNTHNNDIYYPLATPTYTKITDATLVSQLDAIKMSYEGQTNLSQTNNDLPFIINATALKKV